MWRSGARSAGTFCVRVVTSTHLRLTGVQTSAFGCVNDVVAYLGAVVAGLAVVDGRPNVRKFGRRSLGPEPFTGPLRSNPE